MSLQFEKLIKGAQTLALGLILGFAIQVGMVVTSDFVPSQHVAVDVAQSAHAGSLTDYAENQIIDAVIRHQTVTWPATWYIALYTTCPTDSTAGTEVSVGSYGRVAVTAGTTQWAGTQSAGSTAASSGTGGTTSNNATVSYPTPSAGWGTVTCFAFTDASTSGNIWIYAALTTSKTINSGDSVSFAPGALTFQIDN